MGPKLLPLTLRPSQDKTNPGRIWHHAERLGKGYLWMQRSEITGGFVDAALSSIKQAKQGGKPFYLNLWPDDVHSPFWPPVDQWGDGKKRTLYLAVLEEMDRQLGRLFKYVQDDPILRDNTLILACSDNGPDPGLGSPGPFRGYKTQLFEGGIRSSLVAWAPGLMKKASRGQVNQESVFSGIDLVPTLLDLCHVPYPQKIQFDGESLPGVLLGESNSSRKKPIFFRRPPDRDSFYGVNDLPDLAIREGKWKLLCEYYGTEPLLFDMDQDLGEKTNLASKEPAVVKRLTEAVVNWHQSMPADHGPALAGP
jgi:uncharacterized sulfatase